VGLTHLAVQAEHRDAERRIGEVGRLDHVVLLVAAQAVLRAEGGRRLHVAALAIRKMFLSMYSFSYVLLPSDCVC
jgi:hypothetical protein